MAFVGNSGIPLNVIRTTLRDGATYLVFQLPCGDRLLYRIMASLRKRSAQLEKVKEPEAGLLLRQIDRK